ncbi:unnamed protein product [Ceutorhynchus assimilis]|uniref:G-protein coupled receptors family 1 profile domain-containing protein n=1 Tax=Ceutorhynchus assimilis TaxID=467358 RepID=A0A9N9MS14_9CUCU|nr:unnamed protein product [Ceutorhynchus assimilis]
MGSESSKSTVERVVVTESQLIGFEVNRKLFFWIILLISVVALLGNLLTVRTVIYRKYKFLQKTCIISLAVSDILTVTLFAMNNLELLRKKPMTWIYGESMCHGIPIGQILGNLTSSLALLVIAVDRYHNVIHALSKKWNPALWKCLTGALILWIICLGLSYPVVTFYLYIPIILEGEYTAMCSGAPVTKSVIFIYYICMNCLFFIPIVTMFFWFYYKIALLIWRHRKPPADSYNHPEITETSTGTKPDFSTNGKLVAKKKNMQMERKIRSFKIVLALIVAFIGCRLPYWMLLLYQQANVVDKNLMWTMRFSAISLYLLNCALNPFLYTFLNITIIICKKAKKFLTTTLCCWFSNSDFEDFETGKGMECGFAANDNNNEKSSAVPVKFIDVPKFNQREIN